MRLRSLCVAAIGVATLIVTALAQTPSASDLYQEALRYQESKGDLIKAIDIYKTLIDRYPTDPVAPRALLELASCYEKSGQPEATAAYERLVRDYSNSPAAATARARLSASNEKDAPVSVKHVSDDSSDRVSPDGKYLSFIDWDTGDLAIRELPSGRVRHVTSNGKWNDNFAEESVVSPDSKSILYTWWEDKRRAYDVRLISRDGGKPRVVFSNDDKDANFTPIGWTPDGLQVLFLFRHDADNAVPKRSETDMMMVPLAGGAPRLVKRFEGTTMASFSVSPTSNFVAFDMPAGPGQPERDVFILSLTDGSTWPVMPHLANERALDWFPSGDRLLFLSDRAGSFGAWSIAVTNGRAQGQPEMVRPDTGLIFPCGFTSKGEYYYGLTTRDANVRIATIDPATGKQIGTPIRLEGRYQSGQMQAAWSSTGDRIAYIQATKFGAAVPAGRANSGQTDKRLAIQTIATGEVKLLNLPMINMQNPAWMPGDTAILLQGNAQEGQGLYRVDLGTGALTPFAVRAASQQGIEPGRQEPSISADGRTVFFWHLGAVGQFPADSVGLFARGPESPSEQRVVPGETGMYALSPDSRWVAVRLRGAKDGRILIYPSTGGEPRTLLAGSDPVPLLPLAWSRDGRSVFFFRWGNDKRELWQVPVDGGSPSDTGIRISPGPLGRISVHPDGRRLAISGETQSTATWVMQGLAVKK